MPAVIVDPARAHGAGWSPQFDFNTGVTGVWDEWKDLELEGGLAFHGADAPPAGLDGRRKGSAAAAGAAQPLKRAASRRRGWPGQLARSPAGAGARLVPREARERPSSVKTNRS